MINLEVSKRVHGGITSLIELATIALLVLMHMIVFRTAAAGLSLGSRFSGPGQIVVTRFVQSSARVAVYRNAKAKMPNLLRSW